MVTRLLIAGLVITILAAGVIGSRMFLQNQVSEPKNAQKVVENAIKSTPSGTIEERVRQLELAMAEMVDQWKVISKSSGTKDSSSTDAKVKTLETTVSELQSRIQVLESGSSTTTTSTKKSPLYIPLGWTGSSVATDWATITTQEIVIDPADYPGYSSMQFEVSLKVLSGNGKGYARMLNKDDGTSIISSEASTTSENYTWVSSSNFTLPGKKTYRLQLKSLTGYEAAIQNARIRVNF